MGFRTFGLAAAVVLTASSAASAQNYPTQRVTIVVPFAAGSITDGLARILADKLGTMWKQQVIAENKPGIRGTASVAKATADGYTLMLPSNGHTIAAAITKSLAFDPVKDFASITQLVSAPLVAIVPPESPAKTLQEFIDLAKQKPGALNFSSAGVASTTYLAAEVFKQQAKINIQHVPFRGAPDAVSAPVAAPPGGRRAVKFFSGPLHNGLEPSQPNRVRALAVTPAQGVKQWPALPTVAEAGVQSYKYDSCFARRAPAGTPKPILNKV